MVKARRMQAPESALRADAAMRPAVIRRVSPPEGTREKFRSRPVCLRLRPGAGRFRLGDGWNSGIPEYPALPHPVSERDRQAWRVRREPGSEGCPQDPLCLDRAPPAFEPATASLTRPLASPAVKPSFFRARKPQLEIRLSDLGGGSPARTGLWNSGVRRVGRRLPAGARCGRFRLGGGAGTLEFRSTP